MKYLFIVLAVVCASLLIWVPSVQAEDAGFCTGDCAAIVAGNAELCALKNGKGNDCVAFVSNDVAKCKTQNCRALLSSPKNPDICSSRDCAALVSGIYDDRCSDGCVALLTREIRYAPSHVWKALVSGDVSFCRREDPDCAHLVSINPKFDGSGPSPMEVALYLLDLDVSLK